MIVLPSADVLDNLLRAYVSRFEPYFPSSPASRLDPTGLIRSKNVFASSLELLLMIAYGAMSTPTMEARCLTDGLTELCRIVLSDFLEMDADMATSPTMLRAALLFTNLAAWSGDRWHMNVRVLSIDWR